MGIGALEIEKKGHIASTPPMDIGAYSSILDVIPRIWDCLRFRFTFSESNGAPLLRFFSPSSMGIGAMVTETKDPNAPTSSMGIGAYSNILDVIPRMRDCLGFWFSFSESDRGSLVTFFSLSPMGIVAMETERKGPIASTVPIGNGALAIEMKDGHWGLFKA